MAQILLSVIILAVGLFLLLNPQGSIEIQRKFYEKLNWRIEPISMQKEIRNTRIMGLFLIMITLSGIIYFFIMNVCYK
ncbi:MAG: hypothetical protein JW800_03175 [Candidatus Omnitrophica bacterium]|nr:hypothetical protein [Candidatus Omnitrophota bacterium]